MISSARTNEIFSAMKLHYTSQKYNFFKYAGKAKNGNKGNFHSEKLANKLNNETKTVKFFLGNFISFYERSGEYPSYIGELSDEKAFKVFAKFDGELDIKMFKAKKTLDKIKKKTDTLKSIKNFSVLSDLFYEKETDTIAICFLANSFDLFKIWKTDDPLENDLLTFLRKTSPFIRGDREKLIESIKDMKNVTK